MRVLICEDEKSLAKSLAVFLKSANYVVDVVHNGESAVQYIQTGVYDCMVLDLMLPKKDGITVLKEIRSAGFHLPVLILSARSTVEDKLEGLETGANDYMTKPFDMREVAARLSVLLRRKGDMRSDEIQIGNTTLHKTKCTLSTPVGCLPLVKKEYLIMLLLMNHPGMVITPESVIDKVWDFDRNAEISTVWTYVSYLRKKLETLKSDIVIRTKRNLGYVLEEKK